MRLDFLPKLSFALSFSLPALMVFYLAFGINFNLFVVYFFLALEGVSIVLALVSLRKISKGEIEGGYIISVLAIVISILISLMMILGYMFAIVFVYDMML